MGYLNPKSALNSYYDNLLYTISRCEAHPTAVKYAPALQAELDALGKSVGNRNTQSNTRQKLMAKRDYARDTLSDLYEPYTLQVAAQFGSKTASETRRLAPLSPSAFVALPIKALPGFMAQWKSQLDQPATPADVKKFAKPVLDAYDLFFKANAAHDAGVLVERNAIAAVDTTKNAALVALAKVRGSLATDFPRKPKVVRRFFVPQETKKGADAAASDAPVVV